MAPDMCCRLQGPDLLNGLPDLLPYAAHTEARVAFRHAAEAQRILFSAAAAVSAMADI